MTLHFLVLFVHVGAAFGMAVTIGVLATYTRLLARASSLAEQRTLYTLADRTAIAPKVLAPTLLLSGARLAYDRGGLLAPWVLAGAAILAALAISGARVLHPRVRDAVRDAERANDVGVVAQRLADPQLALVHTMRIALLVLVTFLMTTKPDARTTVAVSTAVVLVAIGTAQARRRRRGGHA